MPGSYRALLALVALAAFGSPGCRDDETQGAAAGVPAVGRDPLGVLLETARHEAVAPLADGRWLAARVPAKGGATAIYVSPAGVRPVLPGESAATWPLGVVGGTTALIEVARADGTSAWRLVGPSGTALELRPSAGERWRLLGIASGRPAFWVAAAGTAGETLLEVGSGGDVRALETLAPGWTLGAIAGDGRRVALVRPVDDAADELYLLDRGSGETRLLLPEDHDGRFRPLAFSAGGDRLLLTSDDTGDLPRAEWMAIETRVRTPLGVSGCAVATARAAADGGAILELSCGGRSTARRLDAAGQPVPPPLPPSGERVVDVRPGETTLYALAGGRWPRDLWAIDELGVPKPWTYGLAARVDPRDLVEPEAITIESPSGPIPAELWRPGAAGPPIEPWTHSGIVWIEEGGSPPRWGELEPLFQYWAQRGAAVLRLRLRGSEGFGRRFRALADGRPGETGLEDVALAVAAIVREAGAAPHRIGVVGAGPWAACIAAAAAAGPSAPPFAAAAAIDPDPDPLRVLDRLAELPSRAAERAVARWGDPARPGAAAARERLRFAPATVRVPLLAVADPRSADGDAVLAAAAAARATGAPAPSLTEPAPPFGERLDASVAAALVAHFARVFAPPETAAEPRP